MVADDDAGQGVEDKGQKGCIHPMRMKGTQDCPVRRVSRDAEWCIVKEQARSASNVSDIRGILWSSLTTAATTSDLGMSLTVEMHLKPKPLCKLKHYVTLHQFSDFTDHARAHTPPTRST